MGGLHGQTDEGATAPLGGAVAGFTKSYKREQPEALAKVVDFAPEADAAKVADALLAETLTDPGIVEVGHRDGLRWTITLEEQPAADGQPGLTLGKDTVFVVTGAAGGITSAIVGDLATASGGTFVLLDLVAEPARDDAKIALLRQDREQLKRVLIDEARAKGEKPTPVLIDKQIMGVERSDAALRAIEAVESAGGTARWRSANLLDGPAVTAIVEEVRRDFGRIDVLVHAGGIEISRKLSEKDAREFDLVFDIKADGFFSLLKAAEGLPIGATVVFSSIAGRFGNAGQTDYSAANGLPLRHVAGAPARAAGDPDHRHRLDRLGRHRHGHPGVDPDHHGGGRHLHAAPRGGHPHRAPRARGRGTLGGARGGRDPRHDGRGVRRDRRAGPRAGSRGPGLPQASPARWWARSPRPASTGASPSRRPWTPPGSRSSSTTRSTRPRCCRG